MLFENIKHERRPINLTSLVDVIFQLLIFFMLSTEFMKLDQIPFSLNTADDLTSAARDVESSIILHVQKEGVSYEKNFAPLNEVAHILPTKIKAAQTVMMLGQDVSIQDMLTVMDAVKQAGGEKITLVRDAIRP